MSEFLKRSQRLLERAVGLKVVPGLQIDVGEIRQDPRDAPAIVDVAVPGEALVMVAPRGRVVPLRRRDVTEAVEGACKAANIPACLVGRDHGL